MTVNPNFSPATGAWDGTSLNIPGLMPVDIGSSEPYPVPFQTPRFRAPQASPVRQTAMQQGAIQGSASPDVGGGGGPGYQNTYGTIPSMQNTGDAQFATMGFGGSSGGYGAPSGGGGYDYGYSPMQGFYASTPGGSPVDPMAGWRPGDVTSMPLAPIGASSSGQDYFDRLGSSIWDRVSSLGNAPDFNGGNVGQAAINAAGVFSPLAPLFAGLLQGFNLYDAPDPTGNPITDLAGTPGALQRTIANAANWVDRQFGGEYMPGSMPPTVAGPNPDGSAYVAGQPSGVSQAQGTYPFSGIGGSGAGGSGGGGFQTSYGAPDSFGSMGNMLDTFMNGAGFGGASYGYGASGGAGWDYGRLQPDNNGGWGQ